MWLLTVDLLIIDQGRAFTFGRNEKGQLGNGTVKASSEPYRVEIQDETFVDAAVGRNHTLLVSGILF